MKKSQIKTSMHSVSNICGQTGNIQRASSTKFSDLKSSRAYVTRHGTFQSNYNFFMKRLGEQKVQPKQSITNSIKYGHQRYNSMGNSRMVLKTGQSSTHKITNCQSSPYLLQYNPKYNKYEEQKAKMVQVYDFQSYMTTPSTSSNLTKHTMKLSMKNATRNIANTVQKERASMQDSEVSTINQTSNTSSVTSKMAQEKLMREELQRYFINIHEKAIESLRGQIDQQNCTILKLESHIKNISNELMLKQKTIIDLTNIIKLNNENSRKINKYDPNPEAAINENMHMHKVQYLQEQVNHVLRGKLNEQADTQMRLNQKLDRVTSQIVNISSPQRRTKTLIQNEQMIKLGNAIKGYQQILQRNFISCTQLKQLSKNVENIVQKLYSIKNVLYRISYQSNNILQQTAQFKLQQSHHKSYFDPINLPKQQLTDSMSYFFHPQQFSNLQKITQLFMNRQGQPIKCYTDQYNQVKYKDTNTFMFNKKGDIVQLTQKQKRYYIDRGFIISDQ